MNTERAATGQASWRQVAPGWLRPYLVIAISLVAVILVSLAVGYRIAESRAQHQQAAIAADIDESIRRVLTEVRANERKLTGLAGRSCAEIQKQLTFTDAFIPYLRSAVMVRNGTLYCSTILGPRATPLSAYLTASGADQQIAFVGGNALMPQVPVMVMYHRIDASNGILYFVEGVYITDILARARASGAQGASVSGESGGVLTSEGRWLRAAGPVQGRIVATAGSAGISVAVKSDPARLGFNLLVTEIIALVTGLSAFGVVVTGYCAGFTPRQRLERQVRAALRRGEFFLEYQPIIDVGSGQWIGAEALLRWNHPRLGLVMPGKFISEIEQTSVIGPLTDFILETALAELSAFPKGFRISVNLAPHHIGLRGFPEDIISTLARSATRLQVVLEITERGLLTGARAVHDSLARLRAQGVKFAVDDFGTANSNLSLLQRFSFDYIKIDRQFVHRVASRDRQLIEGISLLVDRLGAFIVAEGVEEVEQYEALKEIGVAFAQGFLLGRPLGIVPFEQMYRRSRNDTDARPVPPCLSTA